LTFFTGNVLSLAIRNDVNLKDVKDEKRKDGQATGRCDL